MAWRWSFKTEVAVNVVEVSSPCHLCGDGIERKKWEGNAKVKAGGGGMCGFWREWEETTGKRKKCGFKEKKGKKRIVGEKKSA